MLKFMKKVPAGTLLIPMLLSALINTLSPGIFESFGGITEAFLSARGTSYIVGLVCFCSATLLDIKTIGRVLKKQGVLVVAKIVICVAFSTLFVNTFGLGGVFGISAIAFVVAICSVNPSLYLALVNDYGEAGDEAAFGLVGLLCVPAFPIFVFSVSQGGGIDWLPIISTFIPILLGIIIGNLDKDMASMFSSLLGPLTPIMGWSFGASINLVQAVKAGPQGVVLTLIFYIVIVPILVFVERKLLKKSGISALAMSSIAGMSVSVPNILALNNPDYISFAGDATAQVAFGVVLSSIITPLIAKAFYNKFVENKVGVASGVSK